MKILVAETPSPVWREIMREYRSRVSAPASNPRRNSFLDPSMRRPGDEIQMRRPSSGCAGVLPAGSAADGSRIIHRASGSAVCLARYTPEGIEGRYARESRFARRIKTFSSRRQDKGNEAEPGSERARGEKERVNPTRRTGVEPTPPRQCPHLLTIFRWKRRRR